jgi:hypothetical protein
LTVTFTKPVYEYEGGGYEPDNPTEWYYDDADGGVEIISVSLSANHRVATVTLSSAAGDEDVIIAGDFHTIDMECFDVPNAAVRDASGNWTTMSIGWD